jgi:energy-coupling factor transporter ATP-binding protein EcfA2
VWKSFLAGASGCAARVQVLTGVSLALRPGEVLGILGERGAGKSTLMQCIAGLLAVDAGGIRWRGGGPDRAGVLLLDGLGEFGDPLMQREATTLVCELLRNGGGAVLAEGHPRTWVATPTRVYRLHHGVLRHELSSPVLAPDRGARQLG